MTGLRARIRAELTAEILAAARRQLAEGGAAALSLRAIARELGMASSAVYRYVASRDELLTELIIEAYDSLGIAGEDADRALLAAEPAATPLERWAVVGRAAYRWARARPAEYALIFGTPVPGYQAPPDTIGAATRYTAVLLGILDHDAIAQAQERAAGQRSTLEVAPATRRDLEALGARLGSPVPPELLALGLHAWAGLMGTITFLLFGHLHNVIVDEDAFFETSLLRYGELVFR